jgi:hypothetical protein
MHIEVGVTFARNDMGPFKECRVDCITDDVIDSHHLLAINRTLGTPQCQRSART